MKKKIKKYIGKLEGSLEINQVIALVNGVKHIFRGNKVFDEFGVEIR